MKNSNKKIAQSKEIDADEQRRLDQAKLKKFEATRERTEELKELSVRQGRQRDQAEEGKINNENLIISIEKTWEKKINF